MKLLKRFDDGLARGEALIATAFLVSMITAGVAQALMRHFATDWEATWANSGLSALEWVDPFLQKGTLWLAFLGASLATRDNRHIAIDLAGRLAPPKVRLAMHAIVGFGSAVVSFYLARAFWAAVLVNADERPASYEVYGDAGSINICDATAAQIPQGMEAPGIFCVVRDALAAINVPVETPNAALQLIVPAMLIVISVRLFANAIGALLKIKHAKNDPEVTHVHHGSGANVPPPDGEG